MIIAGSFTRRESLNREVLIIQPSDEMPPLLFSLMVLIMMMMRAKWFSHTRPLRESVLIVGDLYASHQSGKNPGVIVMHI